MRYRKLDSDGDYKFGFGLDDFYIDSVEAVAQSIKTRIRLWLGEWFTNTEDGTDWDSVLGKSTEVERNRIIKGRIINTDGVSSLNSFSSSFNSSTRKLTITCEVETEYGTTTVSVTE